MPMAVAMPTMPLRNPDANLHALLLLCRDAAQGCTQLGPSIVTLG